MSKLLGKADAKRHLTSMESEIDGVVGGLAMGGSDCKGLELSPSSGQTPK